jgi:hypothetical protein
MRNDEATRQRYPAGLVPSLFVLGAVVAFALVGLAAAGNWPKVLRVVAAAGTYALLLLALCRGRSKARIESFIATGAAAGAVSGLVRPSVSPAVVVAGMLGAGLLLAPLHWLALRRTAQR